MFTAFCYYLPLEKDKHCNWIKLYSLCTRMFYSKFGRNWLSYSGDFMNMTPGDQTSSQAFWCTENFLVEQWISIRTKTFEINVYVNPFIEDETTTICIKQLSNKTFEYLGIFISSTSICSTLITETHCAQLGCHVHTCTLRIYIHVHVYT